MNRQQIAELLAEAEGEYKLCNDALKQAEAKRNALRETVKRYTRIGTTVLGNVRIVRSTQPSGDRFSLRKYIDHGYVLTNEMTECITPSVDVERWNVIKL